MTTTVERAPQRPRPLQMASVVPVVTFGIVVTAVLLLLLGLYGLLLGIVGTAVVSAVRVRRLSVGIEAEVLSRIGARAVSASDEPRLTNLAEGLAAQSGVPVPSLHVVDDPAVNMLVVGTTPERAAVVVTSGLLAASDRIQLEAVIGRGISEIRQGDLPACTIAVRSVGGPAAALAAGGIRALWARPFAGLVAAGAQFVSDPDRDLLLDQAAVALTRYPPGLVAALATFERLGTTLAAPDPAIDHLWMAATGATGRPVTERPELDLRIEALRLL